MVGLGWEGILGAVKITSYEDITQGFEILFNLWFYSVYSD